MSGTVKLPAKTVIKQICPMRRNWRATTISLPDRHGRTELGKAGIVASGDMEPVAAFSRPPPLPPFLGPLAVLSLLEMGSSSDGDDN